MKIMLESLGYSIEAYSDSEKAYRAFIKNPLKYDLIITDMTQKLCFRP